MNKIRIDLHGPEGNAFALLARVKSYGRQLDWTQEEIEAVQKKMKESDYEHLVKVFNDIFGDFVELLNQ
jgi:hypothetical protein